MTKFYNFWLIVVLLCMVQLTKAQERIAVSGKITNEKGEVVVGATIAEKGGTASASSDASGNYSITVTPTAILSISFLGYASQEVSVNSRKQIDIVLQSGERNIDEVVVVGYGTQQRSKVLGSVATVSGEKLEARPITNVSTALSGLAAGVMVRQQSGRPGDDGAEIMVRGRGSLNYTGSLIIVDGIQQPSMDVVNPEDIETISVLKDANTAAIYGARAANGVILITTKKGANRAPQLSYSTVFSQTTPAIKPEFVSDYVRHMNLMNEAAQNIGAVDVYTQEAIDTWTAANADPNGVLAASGLPNYVAYANTDWGDWIFTNGWLQNHNIRIDGGSENTTYGISARFQDNPGVIYNSGMRKYEGRVNLESKINKYLTVGTNTFIYNEHRGLISETNLWNYLRQTTPGIYPLYDGMFGGAVISSGENSQLNNLLGYVYDPMGSNERTYYNTSLYARLHLLKGLEFETRFNYNARFDEVSTYSNSSGRYDFSTLEQIVSASAPATAVTSQSFGKNYRKTFDNVLRYNTIVDKHSFGAIVGHNEYEYNLGSFAATARGLIDMTITNIGTATTPQTITGDDMTLTMRSFFGRFTYDYDGKYLAELNYRRDGSSRFGENFKYGNFVGFGLGYNISKEAFMQPLEPYIQNVRLRGSWGRLGNDLGDDPDDLDFYAWQGIYDAANYSFNGNIAAGLRESRFGNNNFRWEGTTTTEFGLEFATFNQRANIQVDYYNKQSYNGIRDAIVPLTAGTRAAPLSNQTGVRNKGIEFSLGWRDKIGEFTYGIAGNFAYNRNRVTLFEGALQEGWVDNPDGTRTWESNIGAVSEGTLNRRVESGMIDEFYVRQVYRGDGSYFNADGTVNINGGPTTGMIRTEADYQWVDAMMNAGYDFVSTTTTLATSYGSGSGLYYGDLLYADLDGDGLYGGNLDQYLTGQSMDPKYIFGLNLNFAYKNFDLSMIWAGEAGGSYYWYAEGYNSNVFVAGNQLSTRVADDHYFYNPANPTDPRTNINGYFPRLTNNVSNNPINGLTSDYWLYRSDFFKLRNLQIGYTFGKELLAPLKIRSLRVFLSGENLLLFTNYPSEDPETGNTQAEYPTMRQYAFGLNVGF